MRTQMLHCTFKHVYLWQPHWHWRWQSQTDSVTMTIENMQSCPWMKILNHSDHIVLSWKLVEWPVVTCFHSQRARFEHDSALQHPRSTLQPVSPLTFCSFLLAQNDDRKYHSNTDLIRGNSLRVGCVCVWGGFSTTDSGVWLGFMK